MDLTKDHKVEDPQETERIKAAGGWVSSRRLCGVLAVSRSFGDIEYKTLKEKCWERSFSADPLISEPDVRKELVNDEDEFVVLATDGVFDVWSSQAVVNYVRRRLGDHHDVQMAAKELVAESYKRGTVDNTSAIVVAFGK